MKTAAKLFSVSLAFALTSGSALADGREMQIFNYTDFEIVALFGSNKDADDWGEDKLAGDFIEAGETQLIDFEDGSGYCLYNLLVVFDDGEELISEDINVCDLPMFTYY